MTAPIATHLHHRSLIRVGGSDRHTFLQGLLSNDISRATSTQAIYTALLTPQGKFLHDMFILDYEDTFLIDCETDRTEDLLRRFKAYKLRSKVTFDSLIGAFDIWAICKGDYNAPLTFVDPRLPGLGIRTWHPREKTTPFFSDLTAYDKLRLRLGVADGSHDLEIEKSTLAEGNFDFLNGVDWKKGCYVGQELTARMHYRGLAKKRLFPVRGVGNIPPSGYQLDNEAGEMRSSSGEFGLALLRVDAVQHALRQEKPITCGEIKLWPTIPTWMKIDASATNR